MRKCKACKAEFEPTQPLQKACGWECALELAKKLVEKSEREIRRATKAKLKTKAQWRREAQSAFNAWIRFRDRDLPCISCQRHHTGQYHSGHYRSVGSNPSLRFEPLNAHKQCQPCNTHLSSNAVEYRINLLRKIGADAIEWLEGPHEPKRYTIEELKTIRDEYRQKLKQALSVH